MSNLHTVAVELAVLGEDVRTPLREALETGKPLVVTLGGKPQIIVESLEDFEVIQTMLDVLASAGDRSHR